MRPSRRLAVALGVAVLATPAVASAAPEDPLRADTWGESVILARWYTTPTDVAARPSMSLTATGTSAAVTIVSQDGDQPDARGGCTIDAVPAPATGMTCRPQMGTPKLLGLSPILSPRNDRFDASGLQDVRINISANDGDDVVTGGAAADSLTGDRGVDELHGGPGDDYLYMNGTYNQGPDTDSAASTCGPGTDVVKRDAEDPPLAALDGCELEIPDFIVPPTVAGAATPGSALSVAEPGSTGTGAPAQYEWRTCAPGGECGPVVATTATYTPTTADVGREVTAHISRSITAPDRVWAAEADARSAVVAVPPATKAAPAPAKDTTAPVVSVPRTLKAAVARTGRVALKLGKASESGTATLKLSLKGKTAGRAKVALVAGRTATARLRLSARVRKALRRPRTLAAVLTTRDAAGNTGTTRFTVTLRAKARP